MGFLRQKYWRGFSFPPPGDLPNPGIEAESPVAPALQVDSLLVSKDSLLVSIYTYICIYHSFLSVQTSVDIEVVPIFWLL